jgi:hypothetical protein
MQDNSGEFFPKLSTTVRRMAFLERQSFSQPFYFRKGQYLCDLTSGIVPQVAAHSPPLSMISIATLSSMELTYGSTSRSAASSFATRASSAIMP